MTLRLHLISLLAWVFSGAIGQAITTLSAVDRNAVPIGEAFTFTGSGFTGTTNVTFFWAMYRNAAAYEVLSDTQLRATFPNVTQSTRNRFVLVESPSGSCVTMAGAIAEFSGTGALPSVPSVPQVIVNSGAVLQGFTLSTQVVYVKSGGVLQNVPASNTNCVILAENGATLDLRGTTFSTTSPPLILYSTGTTILGSLPAPTGGIGTVNTPRQIQPLSLARDIGPFTLGVRITLSTVGEGTATVDPPGPFIPHSSSYTVTATPNPSWTFHSWSGSVSGTDPVRSANSGISDLNITATFNPGYTLETFPTAWGGISRDPDLATYPPGQVVNLTPSPAPGFQFVGWGAELSGQAAGPASVTMDSNKKVTAVFEPITPPIFTRIASVDQPAVPIGETMTFTGSGFTGTTNVTFFWTIYRNAAAYEVLSDTQLRVTFPDVHQPVRERFALVESPSGSCVTMAGAITEFSGVGALPSAPSVPQIIVNPGAILQGITGGTQVVYVKSGGVLQNVPASNSGCVILAEEGATLDLRGTTFSTTSPPLILYSTGTTILGSLPAPTGGIGTVNTPRQIQPLSLARDIGPFTLGVRITLSTVGEGTATVDPPGPFIPHSSSYTVTATPNPSWTFHSWSGSVSGTDPVRTATSGISDLNITATFNPGYTLETFPTAWGGISRDPDLATYPPGQVVNLTPSPAPGFQFVGWGAELSGQAAGPASVTMDSNKKVTAVFEPVTPPHLTEIDSVDQPAVPIGETMTFTGSGFTGTTNVTFFWTIYRNTAAFEVLSDTQLRVTFPNVHQPVRDRFALVESPSGSCVTMAGAITEFGGFGALPSAPSVPQIIVNPGAILQGITGGTQVIYVKSGGVLQNVPASNAGCVIFAEDGATLDLRGTTFSTTSPPLILYSTGTTILGSLPAPTGGIGTVNTPRQIQPLSLARDVGPFREGFPLQLVIEGPGTVTVDPIMEFYPRNTLITLTAVPDSGKFFIRWAGGLSSTANPATYRISGSTPVTARFSDRPDFFSSWRNQYFSVEELADPDISGLDADPDLDQITNVGEYAFGTDPTVANTKGGLKILPGGNPNRDQGLKLEYVRPTNAADVNYILLAQTLGSEWFDGSGGEITFDVTEDKIVPNGPDLEKVTLWVGFTANIPNSLFFKLSASLEDLE